MPLWKFTTKRKANTNCVNIEKGMTVEIVTRTSANPLGNPQGREQIAAAFMAKYGIDMKKGYYITGNYLDAVMCK